MIGKYLGELISVNVPTKNIKGVRCRLGIKFRDEC